MTGIGTISAGHFSASQIDSGTIDSNRFPTTGIIANTYGDASHPVIIGVGADGRIYSIQQVAIGSVLGSSTNSIAGIFANGVSNNPVVFLSFQNFDVHTLNGTTSTVGFANAPVETLTVVTNANGGSFSLNGSATLVFTNGAVGQLVITNNGGKLAFGEINNMTNKNGGAFLQVAGSSSGNTTQNWSGATMVVVAIPNQGGPIKFIPNGGGFNGIQSEVWLVAPRRKQHQLPVVLKEWPKSWP